MQNIEEFQVQLAKSKLAVITTHQKPDADALGSSLALAMYLQKKGLQAVVVSPTDYPEFLYWMKGHQDVVILGQTKNRICEDLFDRADLIFCLDFSSLDRIDELGDMVRRSDAKKILIDHHQDPEAFADFEEWSTDAAATAELLYKLIISLGDASLIDKDMAECLYAGIMTDTGSFKHSNTSYNVMKTAAELLARGADAAKVAKLIYDDNSLERIKFIGFALNERLFVHPQLHTAYFAISWKDLQKFNSKTGDTEGLVNYALSISGIKFAAIIIERNDGIKLSFRSIGNFSVNDFAKKHFEGGGHTNAAGGRSELDLAQTVSKFERLLAEYSEQLKNAKIEIEQ